MSTIGSTNNRAERLDRLLKRWIYNSVHAVDHKTFMIHFAPIVQEHKDELKNSLVQGLNYFKSELENLCNNLKNDYDFTNKTTHLEQLAEEARELPLVTKRIVPTPKQVMIAVKSKETIKKLEELQQELDKIRQENREAMKRHLDLSRQIKTKRKEIHNQLEEFDQLTENLQSIPTEDILNLMTELDVNAIVKK